jgi:excisionase family DNA binding protein
MSQRKPGEADRTNQTSLNPEATYSVAEVAAYLKVSPNTIYALLRGGKLRGRRLGVQRCVRIMGAVVQEFMAGSDEY